MRRLSTTLVAAGAVLCLAASPLVTNQAATAAKRPKTLPGGYKHLVVIYEENHSFDNLYGGWGSVAGHHVVGRSDASVAKKTQVAQDGTAYGCLMQNDVNLASPVPLSTRCRDNHNGGYPSHFFNRPFSIDDYIRPRDTTCPPTDPGTPYKPNGWEKGTGEPGGCTRDIVHRFYQEQYQINGGRQNRYETGSDAVGLVMGSYKTKRLPIYRYLHTRRAPHYVLADHFFQAAFGGSFLNHQWLIAARTPYDPSATPQGANSKLDANGFPNSSYPQYTPTTSDVLDGQLTQKCSDIGIGIGKAYDYDNACGNFAVNTVQPSSPPFGSGAKIPLIDDTTFPNIGDRMSAAGLSWAWYSGGWDDARSGNAGPLFQYHHQPFNYFANYAPGQPGRRHLKDETKFMAAARNGHLPTVSFVKPYGAENEHPGYASESTGSDHLVRLLKTIMNGPQARSTLVVVTYDEFGGQWDHVSPPALANGARAGTADKWGPGTRIPALVLARNLRRSGVDHRPYDTTSILATIERSYGLAPLSTRDAAVNDLRHAVRVGGR